MGDMDDGGAEHTVQLGESRAYRSTSLDIEIREHLIKQESFDSRTQRAPEAAREALHARIENAGIKIIIARFRRVGPAPTALGSATRVI
jgi:hypothetical protein